MRNVSFHTRILRGSIHLTVASLAHQIRFVASMIMIGYSFSKASLVLDRVLEKQENDRTNPSDTTKDIILRAPIPPKLNLPIVAVHKRQETSAEAMRVVGPSLALTGHSLLRHGMRS